MALSPNGKILVTGGEDKTIFIFMVKLVNGISLKPIGFCPLNATPTCFTWHPEIVNCFTYFKNLIEKNLILFSSLILF